MKLLIIDSKGKLFGKVSLIDIIVVLIIVGAIAGIAYKFTTSKSGGILQTKDKLEIVFFGEEVPEYAAKLISDGDIVREVVQNANFGTVTDVKLDKSKSYAPDALGKWQVSSKEGFNSIMITISGEGKYATDGITIDNSVYYIGKTIELKVGNEALYGRIYNITRKD
jgi:hypothetical protein